jgi:hypothetical protein
MDLFLGDEVIVIQDQYKVFLALNQQIDESCQQKLEGWSLGRLQFQEQGAKALGVLPLEGCKHISPEEARIIVLLI